MTRFFEYVFVGIERINGAERLERRTHKSPVFKVMNAKEKVIHSINAIDPFAHGVWKNQTEKIGDEEALSGRAQAIIDNFKYVMLNKYSLEEIKNFSLIDIGCYDGYLTTEIEKNSPI